MCVCMCPAAQLIKNIFIYHAYIYSYNLYIAIRKLFIETTVLL